MPFLPTIQLTSTEYFGVTKSIETRNCQNQDFFETLAYIWLVLCHTTPGLGRKKSKVHQTVADKVLLHPPFHTDHTQHNKLDREFRQLSYSLGMITNYYNALYGWIHRHKVLGAMSRHQCSGGVPVVFVVVGGA